MNRLQKFFSDTWSIQQNALDTTVGLVMPCILKGNIEGALSQLEKNKIQAQAVEIISKVGAYDLGDPNMPNDSVFVIRLRGELYSWESEALVSLLEAAAADEKICGVVLDIDGPGGMVSHIDQATAAVKNFPKPIATYVSGVMASAHFWLGTSAQRTFIASDICEVGSVGVIYTLYSLAKYFKGAGIDYREIYSDKADLKNKERRDLFEKDDESGIKARANRLHQIFAESVAENLGIDLNPELPIFRGATFTGKEAVQLGYIDKMGDLEDACLWVLAKATSRKAMGI